MIIAFIEEFLIRAGEEERARECLLALTEHSRREAGCLAYEAWRCPDEPRRFLLREAFASPADFEAHCTADYVRDIAQTRFEPLIETRAVYEPLDSSLFESP